MEKNSLKQKFKPQLNLFFYFEKNIMNQCQKIKIIKQDAKKWHIKFLEHNVVMVISKSIVKAKIDNGFYQLV